MRPALLALPAVLLLAAPALADHQVVLRQDYVAGPGDLACVVRGFGCVQFFTPPGHDQVRIEARDRLMHPVAFSVCFDDCSAPPVGCDTLVLDGPVPPYTYLTVFLLEAYAPSWCFPLGMATVGTVTVTFS